MTHNETRDDLPITLAKIVRSEFRRQSRTATLLAVVPSAVSLVVAVVATVAITGMRAERVALARAHRAVFLQQDGASRARSGDYAGAIRAYSEGIGIDPSSAVLYELRGYTLLRMGRTAQAIDDLRISVLKDPEYVWAYYNLALAWLVADSTPAAIVATRKVLELRPGFRSMMKRDPQFKPFLRNRAFSDILQGE